MLNAYCAALWKSLSSLIQLIWRNVRFSSKCHLKGTKRHFRKAATLVSFTGLPKRSYRDWGQLHSHFQFSTKITNRKAPCAFIWSRNQPKAGFVIQRLCSTCLSSQKKQVPSLPLQDPAALRTWGGTGGSPGGSQHGEVSRPDAARSWQEFVPVFQSKQHLPSIPQTNYYSTFSF